MCEEGSCKTTNSWQRKQFLLCFKHLQALSAERWDLKKVHMRQVGKTNDRTALLTMPEEKKEEKADQDIKEPGQGRPGQGGP